MDIFNAYTGQAITIEPEHVSNLGELGEELAEQFKVPVRHQLLLVSPSAVKLKLELVAEGQKVFLYDLRLVGGSKNFKGAESIDRALNDASSRNGSIDAAAGDVSGSAMFSDGANSIGLSNHEDFKFDPMRLSQTVHDMSNWAVARWEAGKHLVQQLQTEQPRAAIIDKATQLALAHLGGHLRGLLKSLKVKRQAKADIDSDLAACGDWEHVWGQLAKVPALVPHLQLLNANKIKASYEQARGFQVQAQGQLTEYERAVDKLQERGRSLIAGTVGHGPVTPPKGLERLRREIETLTNKIVTDSEGLKGLDHQHLTTASKRILNHEKELMPEIERALSELQTMRNQSRELQTGMQRRLRDVLHEISAIQIASAGIRPIVQLLNTLLQKADSAKTEVAQVVEMPFLFGALVIEHARRKAWVVELRAMVDLTAERLASLRDHELERINRWQNHYMSSTLLCQMAPPQCQLPAVEFNMSAVELPELIDIQDYLKQLKVAGLFDVHDDLSTELDAMSEQVSRSAADMAGMEGSSPSHYETRIRKLESMLLQFRFEQLRATGSSEPQTVGNAVNFQMHKSVVLARPSSPASPATLKETSNGPEAKLDELAEKQKQLEAKLKAVEDLDKREQALVHREEALELREKSVGQREQTVEQREQSVEQQIKALKEDQNTLQLQEKVVREKSDAAIAAETAKTVAQQTQNQDLQRYNDWLADKSRDLSQRLFTSSIRLQQVLEGMGLQASKHSDGGNTVYKVDRVKGLGRRNSSSAGASGLTGDVLPVETPVRPEVLYWIDKKDEDSNFREFIQEIYVDYDIFRDAVSKRFGDMEKLARKLQADARANNDRRQKIEHELRHRLALHAFGVGDLILFLPTRDNNRQPNPWAAFNIGSPHYFLNPMNATDLQNKEYLIARAVAIEEHTVTAGSENPFGLADGIKWYLITAQWSR